MKDNTNESNFSKNDDTNESNNKKKIQTSSGSVTYQRLFSENNKFNKKLKTEKCIVRKKSLIIALIIIAIAIILFIISLLFYINIKNARLPKTTIPKGSFPSILPKDNRHRQEYYSA